MNNNSNSELANLARAEKNINKYSRLSKLNPQFRSNLTSAERRYQNLQRTRRQKNIERSTSPGMVQSIVNMLTPGSTPKSNGNGSPTGFSASPQVAGRRRNRKSRRNRRRTVRRRKN